MYMNNYLDYECECMYNSSCCFCESCFDLEKHIGHQFFRSSISSGFCDCGNPFMAPIEVFCNKHKVDRREAIDEKNINESSNIFQGLLSLGIALEVREKAI